MITIEIGQLFWEGILIKVSFAQVTVNQTLFGFTFCTKKKRYISQRFILYELQKTTKNTAQVVSTVMQQIRMCNANKTW